MKKLLLADDSITIQKVIGITFANDDFDLTIVGDGDAAFEKASTVVPDLVLADVYMPGKNGYELCEALKAIPAFANVPVMLLTGTFEAFDEEKAKSVGADDWIAKPFESQVLIEKVKVLLEKGGSSSPGQAAASAPIPAPAKPAAPVVEPASELDSGWEDEEIAPEQEDDIWGSVSFDDEEEEVSETVDDADIWGDVDLEDEEPVEAPVQEDELEDEVVFLDDDDILIEEEDVDVIDEFDELEEADIEELIDEPEVHEPAVSEPAPAPVVEQPQTAKPSAPVAPPVADPAPAAIENIGAIGANAVNISPEMVEEIVKKIASQIIERIAWEVVPDLAESMIKEEIRKIKENL